MQVWSEMIILSEIILIIMSAILLNVYVFVLNIHKRSKTGVSEEPDARSLTVDINGCGGVVVL